MTQPTPWSEPLRIVQDHLLVERDGRLELLDTGTPTSMPCPAVVSEVLGVRVDRLVGCAELEETPLRIDWPNRRLVHGAAPQPGAVELPLSRVAFGIPCLRLETPQGSAHAVLDTGAALSYAPAEAVEALAPVRRTEDFLPGFGRFTVDVYRLEVSVGGIPLVAEFGVLPPLLRMALTMLCPSGWILGSALFRDRVVTLDLGRSTLHLSPTTSESMDRDSDGAGQAATAPLGRRGDELTGGDLPDEALAPEDAPPAAAGQADGVAYTVRVDAVRQSDRTVRLRAAITLRGTATAENRPVQLALVLDRSGSMAGERIEAVRQAARAAVRLLPHGSSVGVVTYARSAAVDLPLAPSVPRTIASVDATLERITASGSTALADGWCAGQALFTEHAAGAGTPSSPGMLRRVLLLSDGHANVGERSPDALARWCAEAAAAGVTSSTVGIGAGYDEDLLRAMAVAGGGSTWYVASPDQAAEVLAEELRAMRSISALETTVRVTTAADAECVAVHGGHEDVRTLSPQVRETIGHAPVLVGELSAVAERTIVIELRVPATAVGMGHVSLGTVLVRAVTPDRLSEIDVPIALTWDGHVVGQPGARRAWLRLQIAAARVASVRAADARHYARAGALLRQVIALVERQPVAVRGELADQVEELRRLARRLERREFDAPLRKHVLQRADNALTGKFGYDRRLGFR